ncbi:hypothetical protein [Streptomyces albus]|uniref:hypothetical protein n=1 Tax=Streptomyces albus TaxID=1888 RepID=UPI00131D1A91|nr:hypothetical protein [Streptomyces albus]
MDPATGLPARPYSGPDAHPGGSGSPHHDGAAHDGRAAYGDGATHDDRAAYGDRAGYGDGAAYGDRPAYGGAAAHGGGAARHGDTALRSAAAPLLPQRQCDQLTERLQHTVTGFVDSPREAVREADALFEEAAENFAKALTEQRRKLRAAWEHNGGNGNGKGKSGEAHPDTEELRTALRDYRDLTERLLRV